MSLTTEGNMVYRNNQLMFDEHETRARTTGLVRAVPYVSSMSNKKMTHLRAGREYTSDVLFFFATAM
jgi:hypothetical protein